KLKKMKKLFFFITLSCLFLLSSCEDNDDQIVCTDQFVYGLNVIVLDAVSGNPIFQDIEVKAVDGTYQEILELVPSLEYTFVGAGERAGTYVVTVTKAGFQTFTSAPIVLTRDECHVIPQSLTVNLQPN
ncbi:MAG: hypothetical protein ACK518_01155, partial [bacterium]